MHIVIVEDEPINLAVLVRMARTVLDCTTEGFEDATEALEHLMSSQADLVLVDYNMPGLDGLEFVRRLRGDPTYRHVPIVMITADHERAVRIAAIEAGATDFLTKPIEPDELKPRVRNLLTLRRAQLDLASRARFLAREVDEATQRQREGEEEMIWRLARAIEYRDGGTGAHISRVASISRILAEELGLEPEHCRHVFLAAPLHDVGKVGVPDRILNKPGKLDEDELAEMRRHVLYGGAILEDGRSEIVRVARSIAMAHHERWDGSGYPEGLVGRDISIEGRIVAVADVFDALCTERPYKRAWSPEEARAEIIAQAGRHFDPDCVAAFQRGWGRIASLMKAPPSEDGLPERRQVA